MEYIVYTSKVTDSLVPQTGRNVCCFISMRKYLLVNTVSKNDFIQSNNE